MTATAERAARLLLVAFAFSLAFMQPAVQLLGFAVVASDLLFVPLLALLALLVWIGAVPLPRDRAFAYIAAYFLAMVASAVAAGMSAWSAAKLLTQAYLLAIPVVACGLVRDEAMLRAVVRWWLAGTAVVAAVGLASLALFALDRGHALLDFSRFHFGTLPAGDYPRLRLTFLNANLAGCWRAPGSSAVRRLADSRGGGRPDTH